MLVTLCNLIAEEKGGWIQSTNRKKCKIWNPNPIPNESITWTGKCESGYAQGTGIMTWFKNGKENGMYEGVLLNGVMDGVGKYSFPNGNIYDGEWVKGKRTGKGTFYWPNGDYYVGDFIENKRTGKGVTYLKDGRIKVGGWLNDQSDGISIHYDKDGNISKSGRWSYGSLRESFAVDPMDERLGKPEVLKEVAKILLSRQMAKEEELAEIQHWKEENSWVIDPNTGCKAWNGNPQPNEHMTWSGDCIDGLTDGKGTFIWYKDGKPGSRYIGTMKAGKYDGEGIFYFTSGRRYEGEFQDGKRQGNGIYYYQDGGKYEGGIQNGKRHGKGIYYYPSGHRYEGEFQNDERSGKGIYYYEEGRYHKGQYVNGNLNGYGVYVKFGTIVKSGRWKNDELVESFPLDLHDPRITSEEEYQAYQKKLAEEHQAYLKQQEEAEKARAANIRKVKTAENANQLYILGYRLENTDVESAKLAYNKILDKYPSSDLIAKVIDRLEKLKGEASTPQKASSTRFSVGDMVCMRAETILSTQTIKGFVENVSDDRIQIRIGSISGGLWDTLNYKGVEIKEGTIIWDEDVNWDYCR